MKNKLINIENTEIIPNGVNKEKFFIVDKNTAKKQIGWSMEKKYIIFVSNKDRAEKNFKLAKKSFELLNDRDLVLFVADNIVNDKIYLYYCAAECLILTSFHEGSPNVIKESMACGCPIITTNVGDVEWVIGNTDGCYITSYDPNIVAEKIKLALKFAEKYGRTGGRERILELGLDSETIAAKIVEVYKKVIGLQGNTVKK